jgi:Protein of unknown function (DUF1552)
MKFEVSRRRVLRGMLSGAAITVGLPLFDCLLNENGEAMASGLPIPIRFGIWTWGLGMTSQIYVPHNFGANYDFPEEIASLKDLAPFLNFYSNYRIPRDDKPNLCHFTGWVAIRSGEVPTAVAALPGTSFDVKVAAEIGNGTRFRSIVATATGSPQSSQSYYNAKAINPPQISETEFYKAVFGSEFQDPNSSVFTPDPVTMARKSVLSGVVEDSQNLSKVLGSADRARLDQHFTAIREVEQRLAVQLEKPPPAEACQKPEPPKADEEPGIDVEVIGRRHKTMTDILVLALACNQTRVFSMQYSDSFAFTSRKGFPRNHHVATHEEGNDPVLGYQTDASWFVRRAMENWAYFVGAMANVREGGGTLLDRSLVFAHSDQALARTHAIDGIPMWTAGSAGGRLKTGLHIDGKGAPASQLPLTCMRALGLQTGFFGSGSLETDKVVSDVLV